VGLYIPASIAGRKPRLESLARACLFPLRVSGDVWRRRLQASGGLTNAPHIAYCTPAGSHVVSRVSADSEKSSKLSIRHGWTFVNHPHTLRGKYWPRAFPVRAIKWDFPHTWRHEDGERPSIRIAEGVRRVDERPPYRPYCFPHYSWSVGSIYGIRIPIGWPV